MNDNDEVGAASNLLEVSAIVVVVACNVPVTVPELAAVVVDATVLLIDAFGDVFDAENNVSDPVELVVAAMAVLTALEVV